jgi:hypothetical protein
MISNERSSPFGNRDRDRDRDRIYRGGPNPQPRNETTIKSAKVQIERKTFIFSLKENPRGRFLRITEDVSGRHDTIIIPAPGLEDFKKTLEEMLEASNGIPPEPESESAAE